ncbi:MAG: hypothetical protein LBI87_08745 [Candidatus Accumulibacter sp.]|nr:hypothetical protein [Accumulibacter sp.]
MNKKDFHHNEELGKYAAEIAGIEINIHENNMNGETIAFAEKVAKAYPSRLAAIAHYIADDDFVQREFALPAEKIAAMLNAPIIRINGGGGVLSYTRHELDEDHIIDVEFSGILEKFFYLSFDG